MTSRTGRFFSSTHPEGVPAEIGVVNGNLCSVKVEGKTYNDVPLFPADGPPSEGSYVREDAPAPEIASGSASTKPLPSKPGKSPKKEE